MLTELLMQDEHRAGREEGRIEELKESILAVLEECGSVPDVGLEKIMHCKKYENYNKTNRNEKQQLKDA